MNQRPHRPTLAATSIAAVVSLSSVGLAPRDAMACGGFFCDTAPIDQAGEQIVFRQQGDRISAMVRILYQGTAEDFSWVVPVPNDPELAIGADTTFDQLDLATRPNFLLERRGEDCGFATAEADGGGADGGDDDAGDGGVTIEREEEVGPFAVQVLSSDNPDELAIWLVDNGYDLTDRGRELIAPYVEAGMMFVALKLRNGQSSGSIQPLIMRYTSARPMVPIRLTAVAAQDDMGVLVWVVGDARAVPTNYPHVTPNYTRLNWYTGPGNAYASYQSLITDAMNEAGGQGFATDMARRIDGALVGTLSDGSDRAALLASLDGTEDDASWLAGLWVSSFEPAVQAAFAERLPLPGGQDASVYADPLALTVSYTPDALRDARAALATVYRDEVVAPLAAGAELFPDGAYLTRLYTTLSADEMTLDPVFDFNPDMPDQAQTREALLESSCENGEPSWRLTLGAGTDREGETVIDAGIPVPFGAAPSQTTDLDSVWQTETTSADAAPEVTLRRRFEPLMIAADGSAQGGGEIGGTSDASLGDDDDDDSGFLGGAGLAGLLGLALAFGRRSAVGLRRSSRGRFGRSARS